MAFVTHTATARLPHEAMDRLCGPYVDFRCPNAGCKREIGAYQLYGEATIKFKCKGCRRNQELHLPVFVGGPTSIGTVTGLPVQHVNCATCDAPWGSVEVASHHRLHLRVECFSRKCVVRWPGSTAGHESLPQTRA